MQLKKILTLGAILVLSAQAQAIILERAPQGSYNTQSAPVVDEELAYYTRNVDMTAPRANAMPNHKIYTYDNNVSEYLRNNLNLPSFESNYALQKTSYMRLNDELHNSTKASIKRDSLTFKESLKQDLENATK